MDIWDSTRWTRFSVADDAKPADVDEASSMPSGLFDLKSINVVTARQTLSP
jgi:hypothetical protein